MALPALAVLLAEQQFRRVWMIGGLAGTVRWLDIAVSGIYVFDVTSSAAAVGIVTFLRMVPMLAGAFAGTIAERFPLRRLLVIGLGIAAVLYLVLTVLAGLGRLEVWHVGLGGFLIGTYWSTEMAVRRTLAGEIAGVARLGQAMGLDMATINATRLVGPLVGGALYAVFGIAASYAVCGALFVAATLLAVGITAGTQAAASRGRKVTNAIADGIRSARTSPMLMATLGITVCINFFGFPYQSMVPVIGKEILHASPFAVGLLISAEGVGALAGALLLATVAHPRWFGAVYAGGTALVFIGALCFGLSGDYGLSLLILLLVGFGSAGFSIMQSTLMLVHAPPEGRSRLMGVLTTAIGTGQIGYLAIGLMAAVAGAPMALVLNGTLGLAILALCIWQWPVILTGRTGARG